jgi:subtilisin family serine protease
MKHFLFLLLAASAALAQDALYGQIRLYEGWKLLAQYGSMPVKVGIMDTGVKDIDALAPWLEPGYDFSNYWEGDTDPTDDVTGHGTKAASIVTGVAKDRSRIVPMQVEPNGHPGMIDSYAQIEGFQYAAQHHIPLINFSIYGKSVVQERTEAIEAYPGLVVVCSGNERTDLNVSPYYPVVEQIANTVIVGGTDDLGANYYNYGPDFVDIGAPGRGVPALDTQGDSVRVSGTSFAAPLVTGTLAAMLAINPNLSPAELKALLLSSAQKVEALKPYYRDGNFLDVEAALKAAAKSAGFEVPDAPTVVDAGHQTPVRDGVQEIYDMRGNRVWGAPKAPGVYVVRKNGVSRAMVF